MTTQVAFYGTQRRTEPGLSGLLGSVAATLVQTTSAAIDRLVAFAQRRAAERDAAAVAELRAYARGLQAENPALARELLAAAARHG